MAAGGYEGTTCSAWGDGMVDDSDGENGDQFDLSQKSMLSDKLIISWVLPTNCVMEARAALSRPLLSEGGVI